MTFCLILQLMRMINTYNANKLNDPSSAEATKAYNDADFWYELKRFNIPNDKAMRYWITMTAGQVCGGISKQGSSMIASLGIPTTHFGQPGHSAYFGLDSTNDLKDGYWPLYNYYSWLWSKWKRRKNDIKLKTKRRKSIKAILTEISTE